MSPDYEKTFDRHHSIHHKSVKFDSKKAVNYE